MPSLRLLPAILIVLASTVRPVPAQSTDDAPAARPPPASEEPLRAPPQSAPRSGMPGIYVTPALPPPKPPAESRVPEPQEGGCQYTPRKLDLLV